MGCEEPHQRERGQEHIQPKKWDSKKIIWRDRAFQPNQKKYSANTRIHKINEKFHASPISQKSS